MSKIAVVLAVAACALGIINLTRPTGTPAKSVTQAAVAYIQDVADQNSLKVDREKIVAYRVTGTDAVVRVQVTYRPFFQVAKNRRLYGPTNVVTLVVKLHRGDWTAGSLTAAP